MLVLVLLVGAVVIYMFGDDISKFIETLSEFPETHRKGCGTGCLAVVLTGVAFVYFAHVMSEKEKEAEKARVVAEERQKHEAEVRRSEMKIEKIKAFALKEMPSAWRTYQSIQSEIDVQNGKIDDLSNSLRSFDRNPERDEDFLRIRGLRDTMVQTRDTLWKRLEDAYLAAKKFEAAPTSRNNKELLKKALEEGISEADAAAKTFKEMRLEK